MIRRSVSGLVVAMCAAPSLEHSTCIVLVQASRNGSCQQPCLLTVISSTMIDCARKQVERETWFMIAMIARLNIPDRSPGLGR